MKLPFTAKNAIEIQLERSQIETDSTPTDPRIPGRNTFSVIYGQRFTGKSCLLAYLVKKFYLKRGLFDCIIILMPSISDRAWNPIKNKKRVVMLNKCNNGILQDILELQEERVRNGDRKHICLIVDDFASQMKSTKAMEELSIRGRHSLITCIITAQYSRLLSPTIRMNAQHAILFRMGDKEIEALALEGLRALVDTHEFIDWVKENTKTPRSFVHINLQNPNRVFNIGFSDPC